jgi:hypothetical protein
MPISPVKPTQKENFHNLIFVLDLILTAEETCRKINGRFIGELRLSSCHLILGEKPVCRAIMKRRLKTLQVFLFIAAFFLVLGFSAYFYCCNLAGLDFRSPDLSLENPEQENTPVNNHIYELKASGSNGWLDVLLLIKNLPNQPPLIGFPKPCLDQETITLRC